MIDAEQWLADLEAKSTKAAQARKLENVCGWWDIAEFREATTPSTVLRLVAMVRWLAEGCDCDADTCLPGCTPQCVLGKAYTTTEEPCSKN